MKLSEEKVIEEILNSLENENIPNINDINIDLDKEDSEEILELYNLLEKTKLDLIQLKEVILGGE